MNVSEVFQSTLGNKEMMSAISSTILVILIGFMCRKRNIFNESFSKVLSKVALNVSVPALAFTAFMTELSVEQVRQSMSSLIWGIAIYLVLIPLLPIFFQKGSNDEKITLSLLTILGSTTYVGIPIISAVYGEEGVIYANMFNIGFRIFLYSYAYIKMSGLKFEAKQLKTIFGNITIIATFLGLAIWLTQDMMPQITTADGTFGILRIDQTLPWLFKPMEYLASMASPLAWLAIGAKLGEVEFKEAAASKAGWYQSFMKVIVVPLINVLFVLLLHNLHILNFNSISLAVTAIMMATPASNVVATYAISFDREPALASKSVFLSTILSVIMMPIWLIILSAIGSTGLI